MKQRAQKSHILIETLCTKYFSFSDEICHQKPGREELSILYDEKNDRRIMNSGQNANQTK